MNIYLIIGSIVAIAIIFHVNCLNIRNGLFGTKIRIIFINEKGNFTNLEEITVFYCGRKKTKSFLKKMALCRIVWVIKNVCKKSSESDSDLIIWLPKNKVTSLFIFNNNKKISVEKINTSIETEKIIEIKSHIDASDK